MSGLIDFLNTTIQPWTAWILPAALQAAVLGLIVLLLVQFRRISAHLRYALLLLVLIKFVMPPMVAMPFGIASQLRFGTGTEERQEPQSEVAPATLALPAALQTDSEEPNAESLTVSGPGLRERLKQAGLSEQQEPGTIEAVSLQDETVLQRSSAPQTRPLAWEGWLVLGHGVGAIFVLLAALVASVRLRRLIRSAKPVDDTALHVVENMRSAVRTIGSIRFVVSDRIDIPFSCGVFRKTVVLPSSLSNQLTESQLDAVLRHEFAHHRRWDLLMNWLQIFATAIWWFHPILWFVNRELRRVREECCDDRLLSRGEVTDEVYSETLVAVARLSSQRSRHIPMAVSMADPRHPLSQRLERIMDPDLRRRDGLGVRSLLLVFVVGALVLPGLSRSESLASVQSDKTNETGQKDAVIAGIVRDHKGNAVAGADVFVLYQEAWAMPETKAQTVSQSDGRFELRLDGDKYRLTSMTVFDVLARKAGHGLGHVRRRGEWPTAGFEVRLGTEKSATFRIRTPDGKPAANALIRLAYAKTELAQSGLYRLSLQFPRSGLPDALAVRTNESGVATLDGIDRKSINGIRINADGLGEQYFQLFGGSGVPSDITLKPVGRINGRVVAPRGVDVTRLQINLGTYGDRPQAGQLGSTGSSQSKPDKNGRFSIPAIATGTIKGRVVVPERFRGAESLPNGLVVTSSKTTEVVVRIEPAVKVRRRLQTFDKGDPIANALVRIEGHGLNRDELTDDDGWFSVWLKPNAEYHTVFDVPYEFMHQPVGSKETKVGGSDVELPPLEFRRAKTITGVVVGPDGKPQAAVRVLADWDNPDSDGGFLAIDAVNSKGMATTDSEGRFTLHRVHPGVDAKLVAMKNGVRLADNVVVPQARDKAKIELNELNLVSLSGRIVAPAEANESLVVRLYSNFSGEKSDRGRVMVTAIETKPDGQFATEVNYPDEYAYRLIAYLNNTKVAETNWIVPKDGVTFGSVRIAPDTMQKRAVAKKRPRFEVKRKIVDSKGEPVADAEVVGWYLGERRRMKTDETGSFALPGVGNAGAWVFVDADGFRFHGGLAKRPDSQPIVLVRNGEPDPLGPMRTLRTETPPAKLLDRAHTVHEATLQAYLKRPGFQQFRKDRARRSFIQIAPSRAQKLVEGRERDQRTRIASLAETDLEQAMKLAADLPEGERRWAYSYILRGANLKADQERKVIEAAKPLIENAPEDLTHWAAIMRANGLEAESNKMFARAMKLLPDVDASDRASFTRGFFAWSYAEIDHKKSLELIEGVGDEGDQRRYLTNIAHELADSNPRAAIEILGLIEDTDQAAYKLVATMAAKHGVSARRLAYKIQDPRYRAHALAWVADGNPKAKDARELLKKAFDILIEEINAGDHTGRQARNSLTTAAAMLPIVERVAPDELREYFWRVLSLRRGSSYGSESRALGPYGEGRTLRFADPVLALAMSRYDRQVARQLTLDPDDETLALPAEHGPFRLFAALAAIDPEATVKTVEDLPTKTDAQLKAKLEACQQIGSTLTRTVRERWKSIIEKQYILHDPRQVDNF